MGWPKTTPVFPEPTWWNGDETPEMQLNRSEETELVECERCHKLFSLEDGDGERIQDDHGDTWQMCNRCWQGMYRMLP